MTKARKPIVCKSNELIEGHYKLTNIAQKIAAGVISRVNPLSRGKLPVFEWSIDDLSKISGVSKDTLRRKLSTYTAELMAVVVELRPSTGLDYDQIKMFDTFSYRDKERKLFIEFDKRIDKHIRDFAKNFTQYQLNQIQLLSSGYAIRIYEILRMAYNKSKPKGSKVVYEVELAEFKRMLGMPIKGRGSYENKFANLKKKVLDIAARELEKKTDIRFESKAIRLNRKIHSVRFYVESVELVLPEEEKEVFGSIVPDNYDQDQADQIVFLVPEAGGNQNLLYLFFRSYPAEVLVESINAMMFDVVRNKDIGDRARYLRGICDRKMSDLKDAKNGSGRSLEEKINDTSWAEGIFNDD